MKYNSINIIKTKDLTISDLPALPASYQAISQFAITFDPEEIIGITSPPDANNLELLSMQKLRYLLYLEQRRWNNYSIDPNENVLKVLNNILINIKGKFM